MSNLTEGAAALQTATKGAASTLEADVRVAEAAIGADATNAGKLGWVAPLGLAVLVVAVSAVLWRLL